MRSRAPEDYSRGRKDEGKSAKQVRQQWSEGKGYKGRATSDFESTTRSERDAVRLDLVDQALGLEFEVGLASSSDRESGASLLLWVAQASRRVTSSACDPSCGEKRAGTYSEGVHLSLAVEVHELAEGLVDLLLELALVVVLQQRGEDPSATLRAKQTDSNAGRKRTLISINWLAVMPIKLSPISLKPVSHI